VPKCLRRDAVTLGRPASRTPGFLRHRAAALWARTSRNPLYQAGFGFLGAVFLALSGRCVSSCASAARGYCAPQYRLSAVLLIVSLASPHRTITA